MTTANTPRTDAAETMWNDIGMMVVLSTFARQLERELADWKVLQASTQAMLEQAERDLAETISVRDSLSNAADKLEEDKEYNARLCDTLRDGLEQERALADRLAGAIARWSEIAEINFTPNIADEALAAWKEARRE